MEPLKNTWFLRCWAGLKPPRGSSATFRGSPEPMKNIWFSWRWDAGGPPEGSFWPFLRPPVGSWRDPEAFLPYLYGVRRVRALLTSWFSWPWGAVGPPRCSLEDLFWGSGSFLPGAWAFSSVFTPCRDLGRVLSYLRGVRGVRALLTYKN